VRKINEKSKTGVENPLSLSPRLNETKKIHSRCHLEKKKEIEDQVEFQD